MILQCVQVTVNPIEYPDNVVENIRQQTKYNSEMKGNKAMHFGAFRTD